ncbi:ABC transporter permease [Trueperella sp. LYQ143]|uniref:ABC transporter permease n=1 Tax=unclassified Trueperella TaxID=2630174 RepID=UPI0039832E14
MRSHTRWLAPGLVGVFVLAAWVLTTSTGMIAPFVLPDPCEVCQRIILGFTDGYLREASYQTLSEAFLGCIVAGCIGVPLGCAMAHARLFSAAIHPYLAASQAIPAVALAPLLVVWMGYGKAPIVALCTLMVIFPIVITTTTGIRGIDPDVICAARLDGAGGLRLLSSIELPLAAPFIIAGLRNGFTLSITGAVVGEMVIGGRNGLGIALSSAHHLNDLTGMFAVIAILALIAVAIYVVILAVENWTISIVTERSS